MPEICRFFGIVIAMYFEDHAPPHFHATYGDSEACFDIRTLDRIEFKGKGKGNFSSKAESLVLEWAHKHRKELEELWAMAEKGCRYKLKKIEPLE